MTRNLFGGGFLPSVPSLFLSLSPPRSGPSNQRDLGERCYLPAGENDTGSQGCSLGVERLGLEAVSRRFFGTSRLVSVLKVERLGLVSVLKVERLVSSRS